MYIAQLLRAVIDLSCTPLRFSVTPEYTPSQEWLNDQMIKNIGSILQRYFIDKDKTLSKQEIQLLIDKLDTKARRDIVLSKIKKEEYPASELENPKLDYYIQLYIESNDT